jgi:preprotein translocase subunit SecA
MEIAEKSLEAEDEHLLRSLDRMLESTGESLLTQLDERFDTLDAFFEGIGDFEEGMPQRRPQEMLDELTGLVRVPLRLQPEPLRRLPQADNEVKDNLKQQVTAAILAITATRVLGGLRRRLPESADMRITISPDSEWKQVADQVYSGTANILNQRKDRLFGSNGQIARDLENLLARTGGTELSDTFLVATLMVIAQGTKTGFDKKTHRQVRQVTNRLNYVYYAAKLLAAIPSADITATVLHHLEGAINALRSAMGRAEWNRFLQNNITLSQVDPSIQPKFIEALGEERFAASSTMPLIELDDEFKKIACEVIGTKVQTEIYRHILLRVISDLWVEYLTKVEALRVSIGLEAYAQRDPLVQYKSKASEMFTQLLGDIRMGVISRMFAYQPRKTAVTNTEDDSSVEDETKTVGVSAPQAATQKKKRHRH